MKRILIFCYLVFFVAVIISGTLYSEERPLLIIILSGVIFSLVAITILMYGLSYKPKRFIWFWKIVPIVFVAYFISLRYLAGPAYVGTEGSLGSLLLLILAIIAFFSPALYLSFKFGYYKVLPAGKFNPKFAGFILVITILCVSSRYFPLNKDRIKIKVDYVAKLNEISKPANYDPNNNAAPYYKKAFELLVVEPEQFISSDLKAWPKDLSDEKLILFKKWVSDNTEALEQIKLGTQKPYYWPEYQGNSMFEIVMPSLADARKLTYAICSRAKMKAADGDFKEAFSDLLTGYKFGAHLNGRKTSLIEQLVGIAIRALSIQSGFQILDKEKPNPDLLKDFQLQLENLSSSKSYIINFSTEKLQLYDGIQTVFTDDGQGSGHLYGRFGENKTSMEVLFGQDLTKDQMSSLDKLDRRRTTELADKVFEYLSQQAYKTPSQLHNEGQNIEKVLEEMTKDNLLVHLFMPAAHRFLEISYRGKVETDALITTLAILRYKAEKGQLPENLQQLIETGYLKELPIDSFSDKPLVYKTAGNDFILYSFAADLDDDGGTPSKWGEGEKGGDQVFWPVSGKQE